MYACGLVLRMVQVFNRAVEAGEDSLRTSGRSTPTDVHDDQVEKSEMTAADVPSTTSANSTCRANGVDGETRRRAPRQKAAGTRLAAIERDPKASYDWAREGTRARTSAPISHRLTYSLGHVGKGMSCRRLKADTMSLFV